jgi:hypothetical protein
MGLDATNAILRGNRIKALLSGNFRMLNSWDFVTDMVDWLKGESSHVSPEELLNHGAEHALGLEGLDMAITNNANYNDIDLKQLQEIAAAFEKQHLGVENALVNSKSMLAILSQYFLPLLYGLLGALAYILRTLSKKIQNVTFTRGAEIRYSLRWPLGMLGGVTVGLFFDPADFSGFAVITPLGLAFLAGYGVELLFTGLDRMVSAFTGEGTERPKTA